MLLTVITSLAIFISSSAWAEDGFAEPARAAKSAVESIKSKGGIRAYEEQAQQALNLFNDGRPFFEAEAKARAADVAESAQKFMLDSKNDNILKHGTIVGGISNETIAKETQRRRDVLRLAKEDQLYIFISKSMPESLIRSYGLDAAASGAILVMRGVGKAEKLDDFMKSQYMASIKPGGMGAMVQLDPRLFDAFGIDTVPSIVFLDKPLIGLCSQRGDTNTSCAKVDPDGYFKLSGSVTLKYALEQFVQAGAGEGAVRYLNNIKSSSITDGKEDKKLIAGIDSEKYLDELKKIHKEAAKADSMEFEDGSSIPKMKIINTPFGPVSAPVGVDSVLKNVGGVMYED